MLILFPLFAILVIAFIYRDELGARALLIYGTLWVGGLGVTYLMDLSPGVFVAMECCIAIALLIHVRANPRL